MKKNNVHIILSAFLLPLPSLIYRNTCLFLILALPLCAGAQTFNWAIAMGNNSQGIGNAYTCLTTDNAGNAYVAGDFKDSADFDPSASRAILKTLGGSAQSQGIFLAKYNAQGQYVWAKRLVSGGTAACLAVDQLGNITVAGSLAKEAYLDKGSGVDTFRGLAAFIARYDTDGNFKWIKMLATDTTVTPYQMTTDRTGGVYITGVFRGNTDFDPGTGTAILTSVSSGVTNLLNSFIAKYDVDGNYKWARGIGGNTKGVWGSAIAVDTVHDRNIVYAAGTFRGTADFDPGPGVENITSTGSNADIYLTQYDSNGTYTWAKAIEIAVNGETSTLSLGQSGEVYIGGVFIGTADFDPGPDTAFIYPRGLSEGFIAQYDAEGKYIWAKNIGDVSSIAGIRKIGRDALGNIFFAGYSIGPVDLDPGPGTTVLNINNRQGFSYIGMLDGCGNYTWGGPIGDYNGLGGVSPNGMTVSPTGEVHVSGFFDNSADFDPTADTALLNAPQGRKSYYITKITATDTPSLPHYISVATCKSSYTLNGTEYSQSGRYVQIIRCDSIVVLDINFSPEMQEPVITVDSFTLGLVGTYTSYQWLKEGQLIDGATEKNYTVSQNGSYQVIVTDENGCTDTSDVYVVKNVGLEGYDPLATAIRVYPNPVKDLLYIESPVGIDIVLTDLTGRNIRTIKNSRNVPVGDLHTGIYLLHIQDLHGSRNKTIKVIKK